MCKLDDLQHLLYVQSQQIAPDPKLKAQLQEAIRRETAKSQAAKPTQGSQKIQTQRPHDEGAERNADAWRIQTLI